MNVHVDFHSIIKSSGIAPGAHSIRIWIVLLGLFANAYSVFRYAIVYRTDMERVFEAFYFITALILNIGNFLFIAVQRQRFRNIWRELLNDVRQKKQSKDGELFEKYEARLDYLFTRFVLLLRSNMFVIMIPALLITMYHYWTNETMQETDWMIPLPLGLPYTVTNWFVYLPTLAMCSIPLITICFSRPTVQGIYYRLGFYFLSSLRYLQQSFQRLDAKTDPEYHTKLKAIIAYHCQILRLFDEFSTLISGVIFIEYFVVASMGCVIGVFFVTTGANNNISTSLNYSVIGINVIFSMFITSYMGTEITHQSSRIPIAIYNTEWYRLPTSQQHATLLILMQAQREHILSGLKIIPCNYVTFKDVMKTTISIILILKEFS